MEKPQLQWRRLRCTAHAVGKCFLKAGNVIGMDHIERIATDELGWRVAENRLIDGLT